MTELPPIYLINLDRSPERLQRFREHNSHIERIVRVPGTDGAKLNRMELLRTGYISSDLDYSDGTLGCALSHLKLWEMAAQENRSITVFEDDIVTCKSFQEKAAAVLSALAGDWDIVHWGPLINPLYVWVDLGISKVRVQGYGSRRYRGDLGAQAFQAEDYSSGPIRLLHSFGMQAYSISAKGARVALEYYLPLHKRLVGFPEAETASWDEGIDVALCGLYPSLKAFVSLPPLVITFEGESDRQSIDKRTETAHAPRDADGEATVAPERAPLPGPVAEHPITARWE